MNIVVENSKEKINLPFQAKETVLSKTGEYLGSFANVKDAQMFAQSNGGYLLGIEIKFNELNPLIKRDVMGFELSWSYFVDASDKLDTPVLAIFPNELLAKFFAFQKSKIDVAHTARWYYLGSAKATYYKGKKIEISQLFDIYHS